MKTISENTLPASDSAGSAEGRAGQSCNTAPRSSAGRRRSQAPGIEESHDVMGLKRIVADPDRPIAERQAAEKRLRKLVRRPKL